MLIKSQVDLSKHCSFRIGGQADFFAEPATYSDLLTILEEIKTKSIKPLFFGYGSNLLFPDEPSGEVCYISLKRMNEFTIEKDTLIASAGMPISILALIGTILETDLFDFTYLLPGSIGAGIFINARYFDREMSQIVSEISYLDLENINAGIKTIEVQDCQYNYKSSIFQKRNWLIINARFNIPSQNDISPLKLSALHEFLGSQSFFTTDLSIFYETFRELNLRLRSGIKQRERFIEIEQHRQQYRHFSYPSAGSIFKNIRELGKPIGQIIDELGLKGKRIGDAMISPYHGNIIINLGQARALDVINLIDKMVESIFKAHGINPVTEITVIK